MASHDCRGCRIADGVTAALAQSECDLRHEKAALQVRIGELEIERDEILIDREVFRAWAHKWMPEIVVVLIGLQRDVHNLHVRLAAVRHERDDARRTLQSIAAEVRALRSGQAA